VTGECPVRKLRGASFIVLAFLVTRGAIALLPVEPVTSPGSGEYYQCADALVRGGLESYDFRHAPAYPAFIALLGFQPGRVIAAQMVLSLITALAVYRIAVRVTGRRAPSLTSALLFALLLNMMSVDCSLLPGSLATMLTTLSFAAFLRVAGKPGPGRVLELAAVTALAVLTLPALVTLIPSYAALLLVMPKPGHRMSWNSVGRAGMFAASALLPILAWMLIAQGHTSRFTPAAAGSGDLTVFHAASARPDLRGAVVSWIGNWSSASPAPGFLAGLPAREEAWVVAAELQTYLLLLLTIVFLLFSLLPLAWQRLRPVSRVMLPFFVVVLPFSMLTAASETPDPWHMLPMLPLMIVAGLGAVWRLVAGEPEDVTAGRPYWGGEIR
jgi:4-amino-4-deoxy-L-arabinose transferase-like glycosyltransferase